MKKFGGEVLFLDRSDINTDEIIPAKYLTEITKKAMRPHLLEDLILKNFDNKKDIKHKGVVVSRANFGCGSSREHAPWAFEQNHINVIIAESFARIFRKNCYNCGMLAIELPKEDIDEIFKYYCGRQTFIKIDVNREIIIISSEDTKEEIKFHLGGFDKDLIKAGGWIHYVDERY